MVEQSPAFQFYVKDWRSSRNVQRMSFKERGMYLEMLIDQWDKGPLPTDPTAIAALIGARPSEFMKCWPILRTSFTSTDLGWVNDRLERERLKQVTRRQRAADWGKEGAAKKWGKPSKKDGHPIGSPSQEDRQAIGSPSQKDRQAIGSPPGPDSFSIAIASSSSISSSIANSARDGPPIQTADDLAQRAGRLLERYGELYSEHRHGAKLHMIPSPVQFQQACDLVRQWDDARLEKLAILVLTTDADRFIVDSDRAFPIFVRKASWADNRLAEWEHAHGVSA